MRHAASEATATPTAIPPPLRRQLVVALAELLVADLEAFPALDQVAGGDEDRGAQ